MSDKNKCIFWDIETAQNLVALFQLAHNDYVDPANIVRERYIICASWKIEGSDKVYAVSVTDDAKRYAKNPYDDYHVVATLHKVLSDADLLVHHNGDKFDKRWLNTRILFHGLAPLPPIRTVDTLKVAKTNFLFNSNKLDYIAKFLGLGGKIKTSPGLWLRVMQGDKKAIAEMVTYNKHDVTLLEDVYNRLLPFAPNVPSREHVGCPRCGSPKIQFRGYHKALTRTYRRFQCQACGGWDRLLKAEKDNIEHRAI